VVERDTVGEDKVALSLPERVAMGDEAEQATVCHRDGNRNPPPLEDVQVRRRFVQLPVVNELSGETLGPEAVGTEHIGYEPHPLPRLAKQALQPFRQLKLSRNGKSAYGDRYHLARDVPPVGHKALLAANGAHLLLGVPLASRRPARHCLLDAAQVLFR
jgi:hypothetical protein